MSLSLIFLFSMPALFELLLTKREKTSSQDIIFFLLRMAIMASILGVPAVYFNILRAFISALKVFGDYVFGPAMLEFQNNFRYALNTISQYSSHEVSFFQSVMDTSDVIALCLSVSFVIMLFSIYALLSFPPIFILIAGVLGPLVIPISQIGMFSGILSKWLRLLTASVLFPFFIGVGVMVINSSLLLTQISEYSAAGFLIPTLISLFVTFLMITAIPIIVAFIFEVPAFAIFGQIIGFISGCFGLIPVAAKAFVMVRSVKQRMKA